jgi:hypothetical protein
LEDLATFECLDLYESEKLESMLSHSHQELTIILGIVKIIDEEIIIMLKDRSSHVVIMKDIKNARSLEKFVNDLVFKRKFMISVTRKENLIKVTFTYND